MTRIAILLGLLVFAALGVQAGEMYKWTDEKGQVHYSDKPPAEGIDFERREVRTPVAPPPQVQEQEPESLECQLARKNLRTFESSTKVEMDTNGDGELELLQGEALDAQKNRARRQIEEYCPPTQVPAT